MSTQTSIITQHNILNPHDRMVLPTYATHSSQILDELLIADGFDVTLYKNSELQSEPFDIKHGDIINVVFIPMGGGGGGKSIISLVAMIGLAVVAPYATASLIGGLGIEVSAMGFYALQAGVMVAGSLLINSVLSPSTPSLSTNDNLSTSTTYSWDESYNKFQQGLSIPKVFGTHKITPPLISKYIETIDNKQYFNGLYAVNDGEVNSITDIKINDETIDNFKDVTYEIRNGTLNQALITNFDNVRSDKGVNKKLSTTFSTAETTGNKVIGLTATLLFQRGLYYAKDDGSIGSNSVDIVLEYSDDNITWLPLGYVGASTVITEASTSTLRKTFKVNLSQNKYYIRAKFASEPKSGSRYGSDCYLEYITEEVGDDFIYPSTALIAIRALATDQLSGSNPKISCIVNANSSNPSLICQQMLNESGIDSVRILSSFNEWQSDCNLKGYAFNGVIDTSITLRKALDLVSVAGRGSVIQFGSKFEVIMDRAETIPVQSFSFGMGNILKDSFSQSFLPILDRANVIEATYYDADLDYEPTIVEVSNNNYDSVAEENRTAITLVGFTSRLQAIKQARYMLNCNRYLTETVSIEADKDSLVCKYGDIVRVSHDVPQYGFSGRIKACTLTTVTIDREVTLESGKSYYIQLKDNENNIIEHYVNNSLSTTDTLTFTTILSEAYLKYDNYAFGEVGKASKLFRVLRINTSSDMTRKLELLEYNEDVYNDSGDIDVPLISALGLSNLRATDYIRYAKDGSIETVMQLAWSGASLYYVVSYKKSTDSAYQSVKVFDNKIDLIVDDTLYNVSVSDANGASILLDYQVLGKLAKPSAVSNISWVEQSDDFLISWEYNDKPIDFKEFKVYQNNILLGSTTSLSYNIPIIAKNTVVSVRAVDTSGVESEYTNNALTVAYLNDVTNVNTIYQNNELIAFWDEVVSNRTVIYQIKKGTNWEQSQFIDITSNKKETLYTNGNYLFKAIYITKSGFKIESENASILIVDEAQLSKNVVEYVDESLWSGEKTNTVIYNNYLALSSDNNVDEYVNIDNVLNFDFGNEIVGQGTYESNTIVYFQLPKLCKIYSNLKVSAFSIFNDFDAILNIDLVENIDGFTSSDFNVTIQISISQDGLTYSDWKNFVNGEYIGQSFKMRLVLNSFNNLVTPLVESWDYTIDMPDIFESGSSISDINTTTINYLSKFTISPEVQITILNAEQGDDAIISNETVNGFDIIIKNNDINVIRNFNYFVKGY